MSQTKRSQTSVGSVNVTGKSGKLNLVSVTDTTSGGTSTYDATISINIDGTGAVVFTLNDMKESSSGSNKSSYVNNNGNLIAEYVGTNIPALNQFLFNLEFSTSLVISVSNADSYYIVWEEDTF